MVDRGPEKAGVGCSTPSLGTTCSRTAGMTRILFLCIENAGRSQMAEAFARRLAPAGVEVFSAGSRPAASVNPAVVEAMRERGLDLGGKIPKGLDALTEERFDVMVGMGCGDACPVRPGAKRTVAWDIPDPKGQPLERVREIRDQIEGKVRELLEMR